MSEFPAQSRKSQEPRHVEPVTLREGRVRDAPTGRRFREIFIKGDARSVWGAMFWDVLLPGVSDTINNALHEGVDLFLQGSRGSFRRNTGGFRPSMRSGSTQITKHSPDRALGGGQSERFSSDARANHDFSVIEIDSRVEAEEVLIQMNYLIDQFDVCTLADFYQLVRISPNTQDYKFGWESLGNAKVVASRGAYYLDLPRPSQIK